MSLDPRSIFSYELPQERIAQRPVYPYDRAKLMVLNRREDAIGDSVFADITELLRPTDILVFNDSQVIPARVFGKTAHGGDVEIFRLRAADSSSWWCLGRPLKKFQPGAVFDLGEGLTATSHERNSTDEVRMEFSDSAMLDKLSVMPIPPYIREGHADAQDRIDYQSNFAAQPGSVAAPTASLHFTPELLSAIKSVGCEIEKLTLHVGPASFLPLWRPDQDSAINMPGQERYIYSAELKAKLLNAKKDGRRVVAVGTTVVRALESMALNSVEEEQTETATRLFISPGFSFKLVDVMVTNFHQPQSTHLLLVESFLGRRLLERAYHHALASDYRFLSYGDGMIIL